MNYDWVSRISEIRLIKLSYDKGKKRITARVTYINQDGKNDERSVSDLSIITDLLNKYALQEDMSISDLLRRQVIFVDRNKLSDVGVIIQDGDKGYRKLLFNPEKGEFTEVRLSRMEKSQLGLRVEREPEEHEEEVVEEHEEEVFESTGIIEIAEEIQRLNPTAEIRVGDIGLDSKAGIRFFSSVPVGHLVLPKGFYIDGLNENCITNKHMTETGLYSTFFVEDLELADESTLLPGFVKEVKEDVVVRGSVDDVEAEVELATDEEKTTEEKEDIIVVEEKKEKTGVRNLRANLKKILALAAVGCILIQGSIWLSKLSKKSKGNGDLNNSPRYEQSDDSYVAEEPGSVAVISTDDIEHEEYGAQTNNGYQEYDVEYNDVEAQAERINADCFSYTICSLDNYVDDADKQTIRIINKERNKVLLNQADAVELMDQYVKYIFEGTTMFNGNVVKSYDYLEPYGKYVVLVSSQSMLQLCPEYNYSTVNDIYTLNSLVDSFDILTDQVYREIPNRGKSI